MNYNQLVIFQVVIFDWVGIVVDFGFFVLIQIFVEVFVEFGVQVSLEEVCGLMGMGKWDYICIFCDILVIVECYCVVFGCLFSDDDVIVIYECFMLLQIEKIVEYLVLIFGVLQVIVEFCGMGLKIGFCFGYLVVVMEKVVVLVEINGYVVDYVVVIDEVFNGWLWLVQVLVNVIVLGIDDVVVCVKVDDIWLGIFEGCCVGMWMVVLICLGNVLGFIYEQYKVLLVVELECEWMCIEQMFEGLCLYYLIEIIVDLLVVVCDINVCLVCGEMLQGN